MDDEHVMTTESPHSGPLKETEALDLYKTELASRVQLMSRQSTLLLQALNERAALLTDIAGTKKQ
jgi:hypothetical protein